MNQQILPGGTGYVNQEPIKTNKKKLSLFQRMLKQLLILNYTVSVYFNGWREEYYSVLAARITGFQASLVLILGQYAIYPRLRGPVDLNFYFSLIAALFYLGNFYLPSGIGRQLKLFGIKQSYQRRKDEMGHLVMGMVVFFGLLAIFCAATFWEVYKYQHRFTMRRH